MIMEQNIFYNEHAERDIHNKYVNLMSNAGFKAVFAQWAFLQHKGLLLLISHPVPASCLHWVEVQPKGFASKEPACECSLFDGILIHLKGAYLTAFPESNVHEVVLLSEGFAVFFWHRFSGLIYCLYKLCLSGDGHLDSCQIVRSLVNVEVDIEFQAISVNDVVAITLHFVVEIILLVEQSGFFLQK